MKKENQEKIFEILKPIVEYIKDEMKIDCKPSIFRSNYGAIKVSLNREQDLKLREFLKDKDCAIFTYDEWLGSKYIIFSFVIDGKESHAWE